MTDLGLRGAAALLSTVLVLSGRPAVVQSSQDADAARLLVESLARHQSASMEYVGNLVTTTRSGASRQKAWQSYRQGQGRAAQRLIVFTAPVEVRGIAFLSRGRESGLPEQWLYLPSMRRERRLAEPDRDTRFAGTDFTFEDLQEIDPALYAVSALPDVTIEGQTAARLVLRPTGRSAYREEVLTLRRSDLVLLARDGFRPGDITASKQLRLSSFTQVQGRVVAQQAEMTDTSRGSRTTIRLTGIRFDQPQPADRFTVQHLSRAGGGQ